MVEIGGRRRDDTTLTARSEPYNRGAIHAKPMAISRIEGFEDGRSETHAKRSEPNAVIASCRNEARSGVCGAKAKGGQLAMTASRRGSKVIEIRE
jgi:hypothetical protein